MAISLVGTNSATATGGADVSITLPVGTAENDVVYASFSQQIGSDLNMAMTTSGYTELADLYANDNNDASLGVYRKVQGATPDTTSVWDNGFSAAAGGVCMVLRGVDTTTPEDATTTTATGTNGATPDPPSINTATAAAWTLACASSTEPDAVSNPPTNYTDLIDTTFGTIGNVMMARREIASPATEDPGTYADISGQDTDSWCAATVAVKPAAGGGAPATEPANVSVTFTLATCGAGR